MGKVHSYTSGTYVKAAHSVGAQVLSTAVLGTLTCSNTADAHDGPAAGQSTCRVSVHSILSAFAAATDTAMSIFWTGKQR